MTRPSGLSNVVAVAANGHSLALKADGTVVAWGDGQVGQTNVPAGLAMDVISVSAGGSHSLALKRDGTEWRGYEPSAKPTVPAGLSEVVAVSAGAQHSAALRNNGTVVAWARSDYNQTNVPSGLSGVTGLLCGGSDSFRFEARHHGGRVRDAATWWNQLPVPTGISNAAAVSGGLFHSLALVVNLYPHITLQPVSQAVIAGSTVTFTVAAGGLGLLSYQWRLNGADIQGATNATFTLTNVQSGTWVFDWLP